METSCKNLVKENNDWKADCNGSNQQMQCCSAINKGDSAMEEDPQNEALLITEMPDSIFLYIFSYLPFNSIGNVAQVCQRWWQISTDELLWREVFLRHYRLSFDTKLPAKAVSWRAEFMRLYYHTPCLLSEERKEHRDEVLHVSFSHDGTMFATCSKDGFFKVWECGQSCRLLFEKDMMSSFSWKFTQFSQFNETDTCLLVSGVYFGCLSTSGEIAIFNLQDDFNMQCRVTNKPYDVFGTWYDNDHLLSGTLYWTGDFNSVSAVWLSKASQEVESEMESVSMVLYRFENRNSSSIRLLHVAEVERDDDDVHDTDRHCCMEHSPSPCRLPTLEHRDGGLASSSSALMKMDNTNNCSLAKLLPDQSSSSDRRVNAATAGCNDDEAAAVCEMSLLDKLLKKSIAENEFDLENEDDTDVDEAGGSMDGMSGVRREENNCHGSEQGDHLTAEKSDDVCGCDGANGELISVSRGSSESSFKNDSRESGRNYIIDTVANGVGVNVNFICYGEPEAQDSLPDSESDKKYSHDVHGNGSRGNYLWDGLQNTNSSGKGCDLSGLEVINWSDSHSSSSSCDAGESNHDNSGSNSSRGLSGGFGALGINNTDLACRSCDCDDCSMEDEEEREGGGNKEFSPHCEASSSSVIYERNNSCDTNTCGSGGNLEYNVASCGNEAGEDLSTKIQNSDADDNSAHNVWTNAMTNKDNSCDIKCHLPHLSNSNNNDDNDNEMSFFKEPANCVTGDEGVSTESVDGETASFSHCGNKMVDNAATQTEDTSLSLSSSIHSSMAHLSHSSSMSRETAPRRVTDKLLIYTWGSQTYIPHKIGIKHIKRSDFCKGEVKARQSSMLLPDVMENLHNMTGEDRRDVPDVSIDMHGHIVGLSLSPDDRYLYVNCRSWPKGYIISDPQESPPLAQEVEISTIDLKTFQFVGPVLRSHKAYTHSDECFFLNLDVSEDYVVSGAEDRKGYIWDRHYGMCLGQFEHRSVVNCMAMCPSDPEVAVSVSDDHTFKVWMSRRKLREMNKSQSQLTHQKSFD